MHENNWQWITLIIALQWDLSRGGIYCPASEQSVLEINVLEAGKMGKQKDIGQIEGENQKGVSDISPTLQESQNKTFTIVWSDFVYWFQLYIIKNCTLMDDSTFASKNSSLRAFIWYIQVHLNKLECRGKVHLFQ